MGSPRVRDNSEAHTQIHTPRQVGSGLQNVTECMNFPKTDISKCTLRHIEGTSTLAQFLSSHDREKGRDAMLNNLQILFV